MKVLLYIGLFVFFVTVAYILSQPSGNCYAPPRTANPILPYDVSLNQIEHSLSESESNASAETDIGDFPGMEPSSGTAIMTVI